MSEEKLSGNYLSPENLAKIDVAFNPHVFQASCFEIEGKPLLIRDFSVKVVDGKVVYVFEVSEKLVNFSLYEIRKNQGEL